MWLRRTRAKSNDSFEELTESTRVISPGSLIKTVLDSRREMKGAQRPVQFQHRPNGTGKFVGGIAKFDLLLPPTPPSCIGQEGLIYEAVEKSLPFISVTQPVQ